MDFVQLVKLTVVGLAIIAGWGLSTTFGSIASRAAAELERRDQGSVFRVQMAANVLMTLTNALLAGILAALVVLFSS